MTHLRPDAWRSLGRLALAATFAAAIVFAAQADDRVSPQDLARTAEALTAAGYESFDEIEFDDGVWEVDDAIGSDGQKYDLKLDPQTLEIVRRERD